MEFMERYWKSKEKLINDKKICKENKILYAKVLDYKEKKIKRQHNLKILDESSYKTLYGYICKFRHVNQMFKNKPLKKLNKTDIKKVLEDFQDGKILKKDGKPYEEITTYFNQIFRSTLFDFAGKKNIVKNIMREEFFNTNSKIQVREIIEEDIRKIIQTSIKIEHKTFLQIYWDIGENPFSILQLEARDCIRKINPDTKEPEYHMILRKEILKRTRTPRTEITNYKETVEYLDLILKDKKDNDKLFYFQLRQAEKIFGRAVSILGIKTNLGDKPKLKDVRSSMACHLLRIGWNTDEVNARLGHSIGSKELKKYVSYTAIDRYKPKKKVYESNLQKLEEEVKELKEERKIFKMTIEEIRKDFMELQTGINKSNEGMIKIKEISNGIIESEEKQIIKEYLINNLSDEELRNLTILRNKSGLEKARDKIEKDIERMPINERKRIIEKLKNSVIFTTS